jgi:hypothetical protein
MIMGWSANTDLVRKRLQRINNSNCGRFREVAMHQIYLTIAISSLTLLVGTYVLGVALV